MTLTLADLRAEPGTRAFGLLPLDLGPQTVELPVVLVNGALPGPRVGVTAGIHGAEYVSIAALRRVAMSVDRALDLCRSPRRSQSQPDLPGRLGGRPDRAPGGLDPDQCHRTLRPLCRLPLR
jgi:hypothetical protein